MRIGRGAGDPAALDDAAALLAAARFPVILAGGGVILSGGTAETVALAERCMRPSRTATCTTIRSRPRIRCGADRSATRAPRQR